MKTVSTSYQTGLWAEALCRFSLRIKFYHILAARYRSPFGEIDIVAARGHVLAIVEVKARPTFDTALEAISPRQRQRLQQAAMDFLAHNPRYNGHTIRFDVMLAAPNVLPRHVKDAWRIET